MEVWVAIITSSTGAALISLLGTIITNRQHRKRGDGAMLEAIRNGLKTLMYDRVKHLGRKYIQDGEVSFEDRADLVGMHKDAQNLGVNGKLDSLMQKVLELDIKEANGHK